MKKRVPILQFGQISSLGLRPKDAQIKHLQAQIESLNRQVDTLIEALEAKETEIAVLREGIAER